MKRKRYYKKIFNYFKDKWKLLVLYVICSLAISGLGFLSPFLNSKLIIFITNIEMKKILICSLLCVVIDVVLSFFRKAVNRISTRISDSVSLKIKAEVSKELFNIETKNFDKEGTSSFTHIINREPEIIAGIFDTVQYAVTRLLTDCGVFIYIFMISWEIGVLLLLFSLGYYYSSKQRMKEWKEYDDFIQKLDAKYTSNFNELIRGIRDIKVLNLKGKLIKKTLNEQEDYKNEMFDFNKKRDNKNLGFDLFEYFADFAILALGVYLIYRGKLTGATLLVVYMYRFKALSVFRNVMSIHESLVKFNTSVDRMYGLIDGTKFSKEKFGKVKKQKLNGKIEFKNLTFAYDKTNVLNGINLTINPNSTVGFVGKSGQGKTTIFNVLSKLYSVEDNMIYIDDIDINDLTEESIRENISVITQSPYIFNMTIKENLKIVNPKMSEKEMIKYSKMCHLHDFVMTLPNKYDTKLGENGVILSGGQKQRLAIARSLVKKSNIILLDEATSALDNETQDYIQNSIHKLSKNYTILIIAHRLSTVIDCDTIFFIDKGKVVAAGSHEELMSSCPKYQRLYKKESN